MRSDYGKLVTPDIKLQRTYFKEMCSLLGVVVQYQVPKKDKQYTVQGELKSSYYEAEPVNCIFEEHIQQNTARLLGWNSEQLTSAAVIHVPYDLHDLQVGCLFTIPSAYDNTEGRVFRVTKLSAIMIYPASITCELVPEYTSNMEMADTELFVNSNFNLLNSEDDYGRY